LEDIGCTVEIPETAETIEGNAILKANYVTENYGYDCFADDSGLEVDALNGKPGVNSARYAGESKDDDKNIQKLLENLNDSTNRKANFKTVICLNINGEQYLFTGIIKEKIGSNGFGYDPIFVAENYTKTFAELTIEEKSRISHRGIAVRQLVEFLHR
jgi:XTP/dITP diphosphohydrolase